MTAGMQAFRGARLKEARLSRGLFKNALGDMVGITGTAIARYEEDVDKPQYDRLDAIAKHLNFPIEFFMKPEWSERPNVVHWRSRVAETKYAREMTEQRMVWLAETFSFLESEVNFPAVDLPHLDLPSDFRALTPNLIEQAAEETRRYWKLRNLPIPDVFLALENAGIPVVSLEITSDKQDGFFFYSSILDRPFVGINKYQISASRARYDASHELGHAILHRSVTLPQLRDPALNKLIEQQAHLFAGAFLFPREAFRTEVRVPSLDYFSALKKRWGMSIAAMVYRAGVLGLIDEFEKVELYKKMSRRKWRGPLQEPFDDPASMQLEKPRMLRRAINVMLGEGHTRTSLRSNLGFPEKEIEQIIGLDEGFFRTADLVRLATPKARSNLKTTDIESGEVLVFPQKLKP